MAHRLRVYHPGGEFDVTVPEGMSVREVLDTTDLRVRAACGGSGTCGACLVRLRAGRVTPLTMAEYLKLEPEQRAAGTRLACQLRLCGDAMVEVEEPAPPSPWRSLPAEQLQAPELLAAAGGRPDLPVHPYGVAIDLGTTHIRVALWNRRSGQRIATRVGANPQGDFGADVLNRLACARSPAQAARLGKLVRDAISLALRDMLARDVGEVTPMLAEIGQVVVVGNTAMLALLTGTGVTEMLDVGNWQAPISCRPEDPAAWHAAWRLPHAEIVVAPPLAGFVGSDLVADLIATGLDRHAAALLVDVGTNTELALWDGSTLHVTSVPGGPAFEAVGIRYGMAAEPGAIAAVAATTAGYALTVLGGGEARGYCGSGLIDSIAVLRRQGLLKPSGRFAVAPGSAGYRLDPANPKTALTAADIDIFQRAKAATGAALQNLLAAAGLRVGDLEQLYVCGAFGRHLDLGNAQSLGLLPPLPLDRITLSADASLAGCEMALLDPVRLNVLRTAPWSVQFRNMALDIDYDLEYINQLRLLPLSA